MSGVSLANSPNRKSILQLDADGIANQDTSNKTMVENAAWTRDDWILETGRDPWADPMDPPYFTYSTHISRGFLDQRPSTAYFNSVFPSDLQTIEITGSRASYSTEKVCVMAVSIAGPGTPTSDGRTSLAGHMWYSLSCPAEVGNGWESGPYSFGFSPKLAWSGLPLAPGQINANGPDNTFYQSAISFTFQIGVSEANAMRSFGQDPFSQGSFSNVYNAITNSCVDFVWKAMEIGGLNKTGFQGAVLPTDNIGWLRSLDPLTGQFPLIPFDPNNVNPRTLLPKPKINRVPNLNTTPIQESGYLDSIFYFDLLNDATVPVTSSKAPQALDSKDSFRNNAYNLGFVDRHTSNFDMVAFEL